MNTVVLKIASLAAALAVGTLPHVAAAQTSTPPNGSYKNTCTSIVARNNVLTANCKNSNGNYKSAQLNNYSSAGTQDIANCNGVLTIGKCPSSRYDF